MTPLRQLGYGIALFIALGLLAWGQYQQGQAVKTRESLAAERIEQLNQRNARQAAAIVRIGSELAAQRSAQQGLQIAQADVRLQHATRHIQKQETRRNDPNFSDWSSQPLPGAARRLHERPGLTGAHGYREWLSRRNALQPAASSAAE
jgi:LysB family phage lysis regulatory protein